MYWGILLTTNNFEVLIIVVLIGFKKRSTRLGKNASPFVCLKCDLTTCKIIKNLYKSVKAVFNMRKYESWDAEVDERSLPVDIKDQICFYFYNKIPEVVTRGAGVAVQS